MFRWLHMTALSSGPLTAYGFMVLTASGQHPEPWLYRLRVDGVQLHGVRGSDLGVQLHLELSPISRDPTVSQENEVHLFWVSKSTPAVKDI